jgi:hypothetical protein
LKGGHIAGIVASAIIFAFILGIIISAFVWPDFTKWIFKQ